MGRSIILYIKFTCGLILTPVKLPNGGPPRCAIPRRVPDVRRAQHIEAVAMG